MTTAEDIAELNKTPEFSLHEYSKTHAPGQTVSKSKLRWLVKHEQITAVDKVPNFPENPFRRLTLVDGSIRYARASWCEELVTQT